MFLAGGLAGLAGCNEILGIQIRMIPEISPGYGFDGIAVSLIGNNTPFGIVIGALLFGAFRAGGNRMQIRAKVPNAIVSVVQALVIFAVVASQMLLDKWNEHQMKKINRQESEVA
jgi:simple sugar transport system permease protein